MGEVVKDLKTKKREKISERNSRARRETLREKCTEKEEENIILRSNSILIRHQNM